jgi:hypothetical protein
VDLVVPASTTDKTADYSLLRATYSGVLGQWATEAQHVTRVVGGLDKQEKAVSQSGPVWTMVPRARQKDAVKFLNDEVFTTPTAMIKPDILRKIESDGNINRVSGAQARTLSSLVQNAKLQRMVEFEAIATNKGEVYSLGEMLTDLRKGLWSEIYTGKPIDAYRRRLQTTYLEAMASKIKPPAANPKEAALAAAFGQAIVNTRDFRPLLKDEMRTLDRELAAAVGRRDGGHCGRGARGHGRGGISPVTKHQISQGLTQRGREPRRPACSSPPPRPRPCTAAPPSAPRVPTRAASSAASGPPTGRRSRPPRARPR